MESNLLLSPLILATDLVLFFGGEIVLDIEGLADLLGRLALDHVCDSLAADIEQGLDIEVVGGLEWSVRRDWAMQGDSDCLQG